MPAVPGSGALTYQARGHAPNHFRAASNRSKNSMCWRAITGHANFSEEELGDWDFASSVVEEAKQGELRIAIFEPVTKVGVEQRRLTFASACQAELAMRGKKTRYSWVGQTHCAIGQQPIVLLDGGTQWK